LQKTSKDVVTNVTTGGKREQLYTGDNPERGVSLSGVDKGKGQSPDGRTLFVKNG